MCAETPDRRGGHTAAVVDADRGGRPRHRFDLGLRRGVGRGRKWRDRVLHAQAAHRAFAQDAEERLDDAQRGRGAHVFLVADGLHGGVDDHAEDADTERGAAEFDVF